jgi:polar amino acid transport system ATP-binding protein
LKGAGNAEKTAGKPVRHAQQEPFMTASQPVLSIQDLRKNYEGTEVLHGLSLDVQRGEVQVIVGPSGCGKSTLLRCINGLEEIQGGKIALNGEYITSGATRWNIVRQKIGMVFQSYDLFPHMTILENILLGPIKAQGRQRRVVIDEAEALLDRVGLLDRVHAYPNQLSGGQKQRVAIVRALCMKPEIMLFDEVTASLDPEMVREVLDVMLELARQGMTMLIVTHVMDFARAVADRIVFMDAGVIVESAPPEHFFAYPSSERARKFLNMFQFKGVKKAEDEKISRLQFQI